MDFFIGAYLLLSAIFFFWLGKTVWTLQHTVKAQASTIGTFKSLLDGMRSVLESTDETKMLARLEAHKKFVDHELEAHIKRAHQEKEEALEEFKEGAASRVKLVLKRYDEQVSSLFRLLLRLMPYVPPDERITQIESVDFGDQKNLEESIRSTAASALYISAKDAEKAKNTYDAIAKMFTPTSPKED